MLDGQRSGWYIKSKRPKRVRCPKAHYFFLNPLTGEFDALCCRAVSKWASRHRLERGDWASQCQVCRMRMGHQLWDNAVWAEEVYGYRCD